MSHEPSITDQVIAYLEGELTNEQAQAVALKIKEDPAWNEEYQQLRKAYLQPNPALQHPWKQELKAPKPQGSQLLQWAQPAVAVLVGLFLVSAVAWFERSPGLKPGSGNKEKKLEISQLRSLPLKPISQQLPRVTLEPQRAKKTAHAAKLPHANPPAHSPVPTKMPVKAFRAECCKPQACRPDQAKILEPNNTELPTIAAAQTTKSLTVPVLDLKLPEKQGLLQAVAEKILGLQNLETKENEHQYQLVLSEKQPKITATFKIN